MPETVPNDALIDERPTRRRRRIWPWVLGIVGVLIAGVVVAGVMAVKFFDEAMDVRADLESAKSRLSNVTELVRSGDQAQFDAVAAEVLGYTTSADETVQGPLWEVASWVPFVGQNVAAVRATTEATHILVRDALPASFTILGAMQRENIRFEGGGFNLEPFRQALQTLPGVDTAFAQAQQKVAQIDRADLLPIVDDAVGQVIEVIDTAAPLAHTATEVLPTALKMLGEDGPRTYLVIFQNNAEIRATGGSGAAAVYVRADGGRVTLEGLTGSTTFESPELSGSAHLELPADTLALYDDEFARFSQNYTKTPNFPTSAQLFQAIAAKPGFAVDGVLSLDPVVLVDILVGHRTGHRRTASRSTPRTPSRSCSATPTVASPATRRPPTRSSRQLRPPSSRSSSSGDWDLMKMLDVFQAAGADQRLYGWFTREEEEQVARELGIDGEMATENVPTTEVGIFLNDAAVSKLEYYLSTSVAVTCDPGCPHRHDRDHDDQHRRPRSTSPTTSSRCAPPVRRLPSTSMLLDVLYFAPPGCDDRRRDPGAGDTARTGPNQHRRRAQRARASRSSLDRVRPARSRTRAPSRRGPRTLSVRYSPDGHRHPGHDRPSCAELTGRRRPEPTEVRTRCAGSPTRAARTSNSRRVEPLGVSGDRAHRRARRRPRPRPASRRVTGGRRAHRRGPPAPTRPSRRRGWPSPGSPMPSPRPRPCRSPRWAGTRRCGLAP